MQEPDKQGTPTKPDAKSRPNAWSVAMARQISDALGGSLPAVFFAPLVKGEAVMPLKQGIYEDLLHAFPDANPERLRPALGRYTRSLTYLHVLRQGGDRHDMDGSPAGEITDGHREYAAVQFEQQREFLKARRLAGKDEGTGNAEIGSAADLPGGGHKPG